MELRQIVAPFILRSLNIYSRTKGAPMTGNSSVARKRKKRIRKKNRAGIELSNLSVVCRMGAARTIRLNADHADTFAGGPGYVLCVQESYKLYTISMVVCTV